MGTGRKFMENITGKNYGIQSILLELCFGFRMSRNAGF